MYYVVSVLILLRSGYGIAFLFQQEAKRVCKGQTTVIKHNKTCIYAEIVTQIFGILLLTGCGPHLKIEEIFKLKKKNFFFLNDIIKQEIFYL